MRCNLRRAVVRPFMAACALGLPLIAGAVEAALPNPLPSLPPLFSGASLGAGWRVATLPAQQSPVTRFTPETVEGRAALRIEAEASYGNLVHEPPPGPLPRSLQWSWRLASPNPAADLRQKAGDDVAAKVCLSFDLPLARVPLREGVLLQLARARTGAKLPAATLCWVWGGDEAAGTVVDNAYSRRVRYLVLRNAGDASGTWVEESRDIAADFARAFGDEATTPPPLMAVGVGADADNTGGRSVAHLTALRFAP